jgi:hypothetical protein
MLQYPDARVASQLILQRLDMIAAELYSLRQAVIGIQARSPESDQENIVMQLYGALGHGSTGEYDVMLDWERFGDE